MVSTFDTDDSIRGGEAETTLNCLLVHVPYSSGIKRHSLYRSRPSRQIDIRNSSCRRIIALRLICRMAAWAYAMYQPFWLPLFKISTN